MRNSVSRRSALASGAAALLGLFAAKARAALGFGATAPAGKAREQSDVTLFRYDDCARPDSQLIDDSGCQGVTTYCYDEYGRLLSVSESIGIETTYRYEYGVWQ